MNILQLYSNILIFIFILYIIMFIYSLNKTNNPLIKIFSLICLTSAVYLLGAILQLNADSLEGIVFGQKLKYFGIALALGNWLILTYRIHFKRQMTFIGILLSFSIPILTVFLVATNEYHHLFYAEIRTFYHKGFLLSRRIPGKLYFLNIIYFYAIMFFGLFATFKSWVKTGYKISNIYFSIFLGRLMTATVIGVYMAGCTPMGVDLLPISYLVVMIAYAVAIFYYNIFDTKAIYDKKILSEIKEGLIITDANHLLIDYNKSAQKVFPWLVEENKGRPIYIFPEGRDIIKNLQSEFIISIMNNDEKRQYEFRITELMDNSRLSGRVYIFHDITEEQHMNEELNYLANYDWLTKVYNRRKIMEKLGNVLLNSIKDSQELSLLMLDIDFFKKINDTYGHIAGDKVLSNLTEICKEILRKNDIIGRYGGEEFLVILPETDIKAAGIVAEKLRKHIENMVVDFEENKISITVSIGMASIDEYYDEDILIKDLINLADKALYQAKREGRNRVCIL